MDSFDEIIKLMVEQQLDDEFDSIYCYCSEEICKLSECCQCYYPEVHGDDVPGWLE